MARWKCQVCGFVYDEQQGLPEEGVVAGTLWQDIPEDWYCPDCGMSKSDFIMTEVR
jgi:rubredoxin